MSTSFRPQTTPSDIPPQVTEAAAKRLGQPEGKRQKLDTARGARISEARRAKRWNRRQLASRCDGLRVSLVEDLERGRNASQAVFRDVAAALGVDLLWLLHGKIAAASVVEPAEEAVGDDDAKLAVLAREMDEQRPVFAREEARLDALPNGPEYAQALQAFQDGPVARYHEMTVEAGQLVARTPAGFRAKAKIVADLFPAADPDVDQLVGFSIARDILAGGTPIAPVLLETPIAAIARRHDKADLDGARYDVGGDLHASLSEEAANEGLNKANTAEWDCIEQACDHPATTLADAAFQLYAASCVADGLAGAFNDNPAGMADSDRILRALGSALRVVAAHLPGSGVPGLRYVASAVACQWEGELPPVVLVVPSAPGHADAEIVSAAAAHIDLELGFLRLFYGPTALETDPERDAADAASGRREQTDRLEKILLSRRATTPAGWRAKALAAATEQPDLLRAIDGVSGELIVSLVKDLIGDYDPAKVAAGAMPPAQLGSAVPHPDAELIAACQEYEAVDRRWCAIINAGERTIEGERIAEKKGEPLNHEMSALLDRLIELHATSADGLAARAKLLSYVNGDWANSWDRDDRNHPGVMLDALVRDAGMLPGVSAPSRENLRRAA